MQYVTTETTRRVEGPGSTVMSGPRPAAALSDIGIRAAAEFRAGSWDTAV